MSYAEHTKRRLGNRPPSSTSTQSTYSTQSLRAGFSNKPPPVPSNNSLQSSSTEEKYGLVTTPMMLGARANIGWKEDDDDLHMPNPQRDHWSDHGGSICSFRGFSNLGCILILVLSMLALFAFYPIYSELTKVKQTNQGGFNLGGINKTGQVPEFITNFGLIDRDTPPEARTKPSYNNQDEELVLVFSDEFNRDGRTFYPGDDPYWEAVDIWYWGTVNLEWYDPSQVTTEGGSLRIRLERVDDISLNHNLSFKGGMIQSWNKFCFTGGLIEASVQLPGSNSVGGLWPALWAMGNLGRAGFGASLEGMWPYSYDECDVGTAQNQTFPWDKTQPEAATVGGPDKYNNALSYLPGQKLSACTCPGESHPGPAKRDGSYVGRAAPEIDIFEAIVEKGEHSISQSAQWAPFNRRWRTQVNATDEIIIHEANSTVYNTFVGGVFQQTTSGVVTTNPECYERSVPNCFAVYGFEYQPGFDEAYITWVNDGRRSWTIMQTNLKPDADTQVGQRIVAREPMYIIANLGLSPSFGELNLETLEVPAVMSIDWIRVYQPANKISYGCSPKEFPTTEYIQTYMEAYVNPNMTTWASAGQAFPKSRMDNPDQRCPGE